MYDKTIVEMMEKDLLPSPFFLGKLVVNPSGLRLLADNLEKVIGNNDVKLNCYLDKCSEDKVIFAVSTI